MPLKTEGPGEVTAGDAQPSRPHWGWDQVWAFEVRVHPAPCDCRTGDSHGPDVRKRMAVWVRMAKPPLRGRTHQQLRLNTLSRREKLGFMTETLPGPRDCSASPATTVTGTSVGRRCPSQGGAHRWSGPPLRSPEGRGLQPAPLRPGADSHVSWVTGPLAPNWLPTKPERRSAAKSRS